MTKISVTDYLDRLLLRYSGTFDIHTPYQIGGMKFPAYGYFYSHVEKYILVREANMWSSDSFEHILFLTQEECSLELLERLKVLLAEHMEPVLVRKGEKLPQKNHMYSYLSFGIICEKPIAPEVKKAIKKFQFERGYQFNMLGFSQAHLICISMADGKVITNYAGRKSKKLYQEVFKEAADKKTGYQSV